jgi:hypothetical protein
VVSLISVFLLPVLTPPGDAISVLKRQARQAAMLDPATEDSADRAPVPPDSGP